MTRELIADISDEEMQSLLELRNEKKAHELQSMITTESKKLLQDALDLDRAVEQVIVVAPEPKRTAQRTSGGVPRAPPEARDVPEPTPTRSASASEPAAGSHQLAAQGSETADHPTSAAWDGTLREITCEEFTREVASPNVPDCHLL